MAPVVARQDARTKFKKDFAKETAAAVAPYAVLSSKVLLQRQVRGPVDVIARFSFAIRILLDAHEDPSAILEQILPGLDRRIALTQRGSNLSSGIHLPSLNSVPEKSDARLIVALDLAHDTHPAPRRVRLRT